MGWLWEDLVVGVPSGTVTFLFTDIEGSTGLWQAAPEAMPVALERHDLMVRSVVESCGGYVFSAGGDGFGVAFARAGQAVAAAVELQRELGRSAGRRGRPLGCGWGCTPARWSSGAGIISVRR
jgi:class 3 adenylate cyclase